MIEQLVRPIRGSPRRHRPAACKTRRQEASMSDLEAVYRIVAALDLRELSDAVLDRALDAAARHQRPEIHVLHVAELSPRTLPGEGTEAIGRAYAALEERVADELDAFGHPLDQLRGWRVFLHVRAGRPDEEISGLAAEIEADLIVVGRHAGRRRRLLAAVPDRVVAQASCSVLVVQPVEHAPAPAEPPCPACVELRRTSDGERWFCPEHARGWAVKSTFLGAGPV
jgi:nucleotide-binding universal stress UspA family protein